MTDANYTYHKCTLDFAGSYRLGAIVTCPKCGQKWISATAPSPLERQLHLGDERRWLKVELPERSSDMEIKYRRLLFRYLAPTHAWQVIEVDRNRTIGRVDYRDVTDGWVFATVGNQSHSAVVMRHVVNIINVLNEAMPEGIPSDLDTFLNGRLPKDTGKEA